MSTMDRSKSKTSDLEAGEVGDVHEYPVSQPTQQSTLANGENASYGATETKSDAVM